MIVIRKFKLFIFQVLICFSFIYSESNCDLESFRIKSEFFNEDIVAYYLSAIDVNSGTSHISLFQYSIQGDDNCYNSNNPVNLILEFSMDIFAPSIGFNSLSVCKLNRSPSSYESVIL